MNTILILKDDETVSSTKILSKSYLIYGNIMFFAH